MNKTIRLWIIFLLIAVVTVGCKLKEETEQDIYLDFQKKITSMESYTCTAEITAINNKNQEKYIIKHEYKKPNYYRLEIVSPDNLKGKTTEYYEDKIIIYNKQQNSRIELPNIGKNRLYLFIGDFIQEYLNSESIKVYFSGEELVLEADLEEEPNTLKKQILYIDKKTKNPVKMEILDNEGNNKFTVKYTDFEAKN